LEPHNLLSPIPDQQRVWRYMDFAKFISLLSKRALYFCNLEILAKNDPHDGLLSHPNYRHREWNAISDLTPEEHKLVFGYEEMTGEKQRIQFESQRNSREYWLRRRFYDRRCLSVNCWHANTFESAAMWTQYVRGGEGIAVTSTYARIIDALAQAEQRVFCGMVRYLDWSSEPVDNSFMLPFSKRASFAHENELRLVYWDLEVQSTINELCGRLAQHTYDHLYRRISGPINWALIEQDVERVQYVPGIYVSVELDRLIDEIYVSPASPDWFLEVVSEVCQRFSFGRTPLRSDLLSSPVR
jgi:hypothetical protein